MRDQLGALGGAADCKFLMRKALLQQFLRRGKREFGKLTAAFWLPQAQDAMGAIAR